MKISEYPQWYWHEQNSDLCWKTSDDTSDRITYALNWWDLWPVFNANQDLSNPWVVSVWWKVFIKIDWESSFYQCSEA